MKKGCSKFRMRFFLLAYILSYFDFLCLCYIRYYIIFFEVVTLVVIFSLCSCTAMFIGTITFIVFQTVYVRSEENLEYKNIEKLIVSVYLIFYTQNGENS